MAVRILLMAISPVFKTKFWPSKDLSQQIAQLELFIEALQNPDNPNIFECGNKKWIEYRER